MSRMLQALKQLEARGEIVQPAPQPPQAEATKKPTPQRASSPPGSASPTGEERRATDLGHPVRTDEGRPVALPKGTVPVASHENQDNPPLVDSPVLAAPGCTTATSPQAAVRPRPISLPASSSGPVAVLTPTPSSAPTAAPRVTAVPTSSVVSAPTAATARTPIPEPSAASVPPAVPLSTARPLTAAKPSPAAKPTPSAPPTPATFWSAHGYSHTHSAAPASYDGIGNCVARVRFAARSMSTTSPRGEPTWPRS